PPHLLAKFGQRDQGDIGVAEHDERGHRAAEHAKFEAKILRDADRGRVIDRARTDAHAPVQDRPQFLSALTESHHASFASPSSSRSAERASRRMQAPLVASPFETRAKSALLRVRVSQANSRISASTA